MSTMPIPSKQALQHLSRLCRSLKPVAQATRSQTRRSVCISHRTRNQKPESLHEGLSAFQTRCFATAPNRAVQPARSEETDPQNIASPSLPDITNYYTLFPSTLPNGPPGPNVLSQTPQETTGDTNPTTPTTSPTPEFSIHLQTLRKEFLQLQSLHHPDKYPTGSTAHQKALALSSLINSAYKTLSDPLLRAQYLLQLQYDIDVTSEDNAAHPTDQATLLEVMEAQERIEDAKTQEEIDGIKDENEERIAKTGREMGEAFERGEVERAKEECVRLKYWRSLQGALQEWEPGKEVRLIH